MKPNTELKELKLTIEGETFQWPEQFITGKQIKQLGDIDDHVKIYLDNTGNYEDELISDDTKVDLARPGVEHIIIKEGKVEVSLVEIPIKLTTSFRGKVTT